MPRLGLYLDSDDRIQRTDDAARDYPSSHIHVGDILITIGRHDVQVARRLAGEILAGADFVERAVAAIEPLERAAKERAKAEADRLLSVGRAMSTTGKVGA